MGMAGVFVPDVSYPLKAKTGVDISYHWAQASGPLFPKWPPGTVACLKGVKARKGGSLRFMWYTNMQNVTGKRWNNRAGGWSPPPVVIGRLVEPGPPHPQCCA